MKVFLLFKDRDFDLQNQTMLNEQDLIKDLELDTLFNAMAHGDDFLLNVVKKVVLSPQSDLDTIIYRQHILKDCLKNPSVIREMYDIAVRSIELEKKSFFSIFNKYPDSILHNSIEVLQMFSVTLRKLRSIADEHSSRFESQGFTTLFSTLKQEITDEYLAVIQNHLNTLKFSDGMLISARLGQGNKGTDYVLCQYRSKSHGWLDRIFAKKSPNTFAIGDRDEGGMKALSELRDRGINLVANALAQATDHILNFFIMLRTELAFYIGCINLREELSRLGEPVTFPVPIDAGKLRHAFQGLYDVCLALTTKQMVVGNDVNADHKDLIIITGANQGGKSTFLRSIGLSQLMMQCGMFVPAESFRANICDHLFTHYKREEDTAMESGKLDEELERMSNIVDHITPNSLLLLNESFAATNEREGSEIARQILSALMEKGIKVFFVTHLFEFAHSFYDKKIEGILFLRAERNEDGTRTFKLREGEPLQTSFGKDLYKRIFSKTR